MTESAAHPLPIGSSTFSALRAGREIYVDKTALLYDLCRGRRKIFLSRPPRFGKTLLVSAFESLFKYGLRDFAGLDIEDLWKDQTYCVVRLDFSEIKEFGSPDDFQRQFLRLLQERFEDAGYAGTGDLLTFSTWLSKLPDTSLVLLIDEYDAPLTACLNNPEAFQAVQKLLNSFYLKLKAHEGCLRFFFMTGITKLFITGIFSTFNNLTDVSTDACYGALLGYTEEEICRDFEPYLENAQKLLKLSSAELLSKLREHYNGFCFDENAASHVYCPWSVLNFLAAPQRGFQNYWYQSGGQPSVLMQYLKHHKLEDPAKYNAAIGLSLADLSASQSITRISLEALLVQSGYLTIKKLLMPGYVEVGYPNREVSVSMARLYADELLRNADRIEIGLPRIEETLANGTLDQVVELFNCVFNSIDYQRYPVRDEHACRAFLQVLLLGAAMLPQVEVHTSQGRSDLEVDAGHRHWVFELKFAQTMAQAHRLLAEAVQQVQSRGYGQTPHNKKLTRAVLVFSAENRRFVVWQKVEQEKA